MVEEDKNLWWYKKTYQSLVDSRKYRGTKRKKNDGLNKHHIIPRCIGGKDESDNYVLLTYREHIIAHMLLARIHKDNIELSHTVYMMFNSGHKTDPSVRLSTRVLEEYRLSSIKYLSIKNTGKKTYRGI